MATVSANKLELLQIAEAVAREKAIDRRIVLGAMEDAIANTTSIRIGLAISSTASSNASNTATW